jgi:tryptophan synthase beta chain
MTPLLPMYTLGHTFKPATIHAGGLRYHGAGVVLSQLMKDGYMEAVDIEQTESFKAGVLFAQTEGIIPAPESCHAIAATVREALKCKETGEQKTILFNLSGHGFVDMSAYDQYLSGELQDFHVSEEDLARYMASADALNQK